MSELNLPAFHEIPNALPDLIMDLRDAGSTDLADMFTQVNTSAREVYEASLRILNADEETLERMFDSQQLEQDAQATMRCAHLTNIALAALCEAHPQMALNFFYITLLQQHDQIHDQIELLEMTDADLFDF